jgi:predicted ATP-grasp superfamily ATP-dependent carboligase
LVVKGSLESGFVRYAYNLGELKEKVREIQRLQGEYPLIQEYIPGVGFGFFGLFNKGELRALFMHKRVREYPVKGGPSTCAKSVFEPKLLDYIIKLFKALKWHGIVMVEFRRDVRDEEFKLMEINPKFWGSLDLAIASGVDFPYLLYKMAVEGDVEPSFRYKIGVRFLWPFPDDFQRIIEKPLEIKSFLSDLFNPIVEKNISFSDMTPNLIQLIETVYLTARKL